jgi:predicted RNase H-like nuclease
MRLGFTLYRRLEGLGYCPYPQDNGRQCLEVYPHASFTVLLGHPPFPKHSLEGRLQRQLILYESDLNLPNPMLFFEEITRHRLLQGVLPVERLYLPEQLDALVAAYTSWLASTHADRVTLLGHEEEGFVVLPSAELKNRY